MKRLKYYFRLYQEFLRIGMLCLVQYPMDSTIRLISIIAREAAGFLGVFAIANVVGTLGEWSIYGVCLIFSLGAMTEAISRGLLDNVWSIGSFVRKGKLDIFLIRPASVLFQMLTFRMEFASLVRFFSAVFFDDLVTRKIRGRVFDWFDRIFNRVSRDGHNFEFFPLFDF